MGLLETFVTCYTIVTGGLIILQGGLIAFELLNNRPKEVKKVKREKSFLKED